VEVEETERRGEGGQGREVREERGGRRQGGGEGREKELCMLMMSLLH